MTTDPAPLDQGGSKTSVKQTMKQVVEANYTLITQIQVVPRFKLWLSMVMDTEKKG